MRSIRESILGATPNSGRNNNKQNEGESVNKSEVEKVRELLQDLGFIVEAIDLNAERFTIRARPSRGDE